MTANDVKRRLREAATTFWAWHANQPKVGPKGYGSNWPAVVREAAEAYGYNPAETKPAVPTARAITEMDEALNWLNLVERQDQKMLWAWAQGVAVWRIGQRYGKSERTTLNWINRACGIIAGAIKNAA